METMSTMFDEELDYDVYQVDGEWRRYAREDREYYKHAPDWKWDGNLGRRYKSDK